MKTFNTRAAMTSTSVALALAGTVAIASLPLGSGLVLATALFAGLAYVAFAAQSGRFGDESRFVYRPVYARPRTVQRRVSSRDQ